MGPTTASRRPASDAKHLAASPARRVLHHPAAFVAQTLKAFRANQGLLLAGAVGHYSLLSIVPLLIPFAIAISYLVEPTVLLDAIGRYLA